MKVFLVHLNAYGSSSLDKPDYYGHMGEARGFKNHVTKAVFSFVVTSTYV